MSKIHETDLSQTLRYIYGYVPSSLTVRGFLSYCIPQQCFDVKTCGDPDLQAQQKLLSSDENLSIGDRETLTDGKALESEPILAQPLRKKVTTKGLTGKAYRDALREKYGFEKPKSNSKNKVMDENLNEMHKRGEALRNTEDAARQIADEASSLASVASKIKERQKRRNFFGL
mmetsp:Transcript_26233/g.36533  ORF Transcript_26233/g.36533 Transcript_26233/m.36533 type:complete len:173 (+) Transcript_26233:282-800(+)|eukprot:CAMPEP_0184488578 /NCGR_PEP_ID=MMETSP0113_2-20130426/12507_1 /TAXON_ID=91329 /ORGANISM="Norrisiella sphaerica, Strain BC52" /LENGTH=172 /DNA_ID=CAMNT_0026871451 /DNA_START=277 /DNA_END=795 /DNA_ORIENTATION=-